MPKVGQITATPRARYTQGGPHFKISNQGARDLGSVFHGPPSPFCIFFSFTRPAHSGSHTRKKIRNNRRGNEHFFVFHFCTFVVP